MHTNLTGKTAIVTGAAGSLGGTTAQLFLEAGANVALVDRDADALDRIATRLAANHAGRFTTSIADVSDQNDTERYVAAACDAFGGIDILFSNAGNDGPILNTPDYPVQTFDSLHQVHVRGTFLALRATIPHLREGGRIVVTSSVLGVSGIPGNIAYVSAKHALVGMVRGVAKEVAGRKITINAVCPGPVDNDFMRTAEASMSELLGRDAGEMFDNEKIPLGRHMQPAEVAGCVLFLCSPAAAATTGSCLMVDGGMSL